MLDSRRFVAFIRFDWFSLLYRILYTHILVVVVLYEYVNVSRPFMNSEQWEEAYQNVLFVPSFTYYWIFGLHFLYDGNVHRSWRSRNSSGRCNILHSTVRLDWIYSTKFWLLCESLFFLDLIERRIITWKWSMYSMK